MKLPVDILSGNYKKPRFFLCNADKEIITQLETTDTQGSFKFNGLSELSFEVSRFYTDDITGEIKVNPYYSKIEAFRLIYIEGFGYFELQGPEITGDGIKEAKSCRAYSLEYVLSTKYIEDFYINTGKTGSIEVTYAEDVLGDINKIEPVTLYNPSNKNLSLLHLVLEKAYGWSIGHVDTSLQTLSRQFEIDRQSIYDFLMNEICEKFNCYMVFNTINNTINVYAESLTAKFIGDGEVNTFIISPPFAAINTVSVDGYKTTRWSYNNATGTLVLEDTPVSGARIEVVDGALTEWETDVFVSFENLAQEINISYDADNIKTVLTVTYGDDGDIREVNLGLPYLTDLSYYYTEDWMGKDLYDAYTKYLQKSNNSQSNYTNNSQEILKLNDQIYYEKTRLSLEYSLANSVSSTTVGTYYVRRKNTDGTFYYKEVSLPNEYDANETYYSNLTVNVTEEKMSDLYDVLKKYFNNENTDDHSGGKDITSWKTDLNELKDPFKFMKTHTVTYLSTELSKVTQNRIGNSTAETAIKNFLAEVWSELGKTPLEALYLEPYKTRQETDVEAGWSNKDNTNYPYYYPVLLYITSIESAIAIRDASIKNYEGKRSVFEKANAEISNDLLMDKNFTKDQLVRLSAFLREDELTIEDIIETSQDDLSSSFKVKQDAMESGRIELQKLCQPQLQFSMTMANIYALPEFEPIVNQFQLGRVIRVALRPDYIKQSRLLQVDINFDDFSDFSCEFGELTDLRNQSDIHADLLANAITAGKSVATNASYWTRGADKATSTDLRIQQGLLDATTQIKAIDGTQGVVIDKYGIKLQKIINPDTGELDLHQMWLVNNMILVSDDGFKTSKSALGQLTVDGNEYYGLIAEMILTGYIEGSTIRGGTIQIGEHKNASGEIEYYFDVDKNGNVVMNGDSVKIKGDITATSLTLTDCKIPATDVSGLSTVATSGKYSDLSGQPTIPTSVKDLGLDTSEIIYKGDIKQSTKTDSNGVSYLETKVPTDGGYITYSTYDTNDYVVFGRAKGTNTSDKTYFCLSKEGLLTARNAVIYGELHAGFGDIAGWKIDTDKLYIGWVYDHDNDKYVRKGAGLGATSVGTDPAFYAGFSSKYGKNPWLHTQFETSEEKGDWRDHTKFYVTNDGFLYAQEAEIIGDISATSFTARDINNTVYAKLDNRYLKITSDAYSLPKVSLGYSDSRVQMILGAGDSESSYSQRWYFTKRDEYGEIKYFVNNDEGFFAAFNIIYSNQKNVLSFGYSKYKSTSKTYEPTGMLTIAPDGTITMYSRLYADVDNPINPYFTANHLYMALNSTEITINGWVKSASAISDNSDERLKHSIVSMPDQYEVLFDELNSVIFKYTDGTSDRFHTGFIAQQVEKSIDSAGLTSQDFAGLCIDTNGFYSLRYGEFVALNTWQIQKAKARISVLENEIETLKEQVKQLINKE